MVVVVHENVCFRARLSVLLLLARWRVSRGVYHWSWWLDSLDRPWSFVVLENVLVYRYCSCLQGGVSPAESTRNDETWSCREWKYRWSWWLWSKLAFDRRWSFVVHENVCFQFRLSVPILLARRRVSCGALIWRDTNEWCMPHCSEWI